MKLGQMLRPLLPAKLKNKVPVAQPAGAWPTRVHPEKCSYWLVVCSQRWHPTSTQQLPACWTQPVFKRLLPKAGCCGAVKFHLNGQDGGEAAMRANIDAWWPWIDPQTPEERVWNPSS